MIVFEIPSEDRSLIIPQLCLELHCLPDEIKNSDYNDIENILSVLRARARAAKKKSK